MTDLALDGSLPYSSWTMKDLVLLLIHLLTTLAKLLGPGGAKAIVADSLLMKQQLLVQDIAFQPCIRVEK